MTQSSYVPQVTHTDAQALSFFETLLGAIATNNAGPVEPTETFPYMLWYDTTANILKMRNAAPASGWISLFSFDQLAGLARLFIGTQLVDAAGDQQGVLNGVVQGDWNTGTSDLESLISPAKLVAAVQTHAPSVDVGAAVAALGVGARGTPALLLNVSSTNFVEGSQTSGSNLRYAATEIVTQGGAPPGTWRCHAQARGSGSSPVGSRIGVWVRVA
ncbi:hypothetical protein [uncultured Roseobacter sp.]|uniref:hypothetical protein n=1 Tax=uncultured Roseobacter sp. TaxID=114847 RepID=UPI002601CF0D|nr:hypothetical protein [uncultured Roseobacter sp.]